MDDVTFISLMCSVLTYIILGVYIAIDVKREIKPKAYVLRKQNNTYYRIFTKYLKNTDNDFTFGAKKYVVDWDKPAFFITRYWHHVPIFVYLEDKPFPLSVVDEIKFNGVEKAMSKFGFLAEREAIKQLVEATRGSVLEWSMVFVWVLLALAVGLCIGYIVYPYVNPLPSPSPS